MFHVLACPVELTLHPAQQTISPFEVSSIWHPDLREDKRSGKANLWQKFDIKIRSHEWMEEAILQMPRNRNAYGTW